MSTSGRWRTPPTRREATDEELFVKTMLFRRIEDCKPAGPAPEEVHPEREGGSSLMRVTRCLPANDGRGHRGIRKHEVETLGPEGLFREIPQHELLCDSPTHTLIVARPLFPLRPLPDGHRLAAARAGVSDCAGFAPN